MALSFELLGPDDKPALLALSSPELIEAANNALHALGYKVHLVESHEDFETRFLQVQYHIVVIEEQFAAPSRAENQSLQRLQTMVMAQRRHAATVLIGDSWPSLHRMWSWKESVNAVVNRADIASLPDIFQQVASEHILLYQTFRDVQSQLAKGR